MNRVLDPEEYLEPRCLLCEDPFGPEPMAKSIPQQRIIQKMNEYMSRRDYAGAERHLLYWLEEAKLGKDKRGELMVRNELIGHYRKVNDRKNAFQNGEKAIELISDLGFENTISAGTTYINYATACNAFDENNKALELFEKAKAIYESAVTQKPELLGGLYNNMALVLVALNRIPEAYILYDKAILKMSEVENGELEQAITYLNIANAVEIEKGMEEGEHKIFQCLDHAQQLLDSPTVPHDGYYAFVCEKCAPTFSYYGYFSYSETLNKRAREIYERT